MYKLKEYSNNKELGCIIASVVDSDTLKHLCFTVADRNLERYTDKNFRIAASAMKWAYNNFNGLYND